MQTASDIEPTASQPGLNALCQIVVGGDGIITFTVLNLDTLFHFTREDVENYLSAHVTCDTNQPMRLLFDFRRAGALDSRALHGLNAVSGALSNHPATRSAYLAGTKDQFTALYTANKIRSGTHLGEVEIFLDNEPAARHWLLGNEYAPCKRFLLDV